MDELLVVLLVLFLISIPIVAFLAYAKARKVEEQVQTASLKELISRVWSLETQLEELKRIVLKDGLPGSNASPITRERSVAVTSPPQPEPDFPGQPPVTEKNPSIPTSPSPGIPHPVFTASPLTLPAQRPPKASQDLESLIAGRWFNRIGIVALLLAVSYFLKLAFDNNWIGPTGRVAIGILLGAMMLPWSQWLFGKGYTYFSEGITALGEATLFLSVWAGCQYYTLYSLNVGFVAMLVITASMTAIAIGRNSQRIAVLGLLGGFLSPILASSGKDQQVFLFTYLLILGAGMLAISWKKEWIALPPLSFFGTQMYFWGWYERFYSRATHLEPTLIFATLFFVLFAVLPVWHARKTCKLSELENLVHCVNSFVYFFTLCVLLWPEDRWPLTLLTLSLAVVHVALARLMPSKDVAGSEQARNVFAGLGLTFATLAIPVRLDGKWITIAFAIEGAALVWNGFQSAGNLLRQAGYLLLMIAAGRLLFLPPDGGTFLFNPRFGTYLVLMACFGAVLLSARKQENWQGLDKAGLIVVAIALNVFALIALSWELWDYFGRTIVGLEGFRAQHLALSVLWTVYASLLILVGVLRKSALLRWQSLVLFGLVVLKVFLYDLASLDRVYRILSIFFLGAVLLVVSFLYQKKVARERSAS